VAYRKFLPIEKFLKTRAKAIVAVSHYDYDNLASEGITKNTFVVYNGARAISPNVSLTLPVPLGKKTILTIARIAPPKLYSLFEAVAKQLPQYNFVWIGNKATPPDTPENVFCLGEIPNAAQYYFLADLCLLPSNYEGLPMTIIEAMSAAKPVVASDVGGISEIVRNGENGYCLENNAELFAEKIQSILENEDLYEKMSQASKQIFENELTVEKMVGRYLNIYQL
jgi:glycosyltransferase involved in cell wall biosynthesis